MSERDIFIQKIIQKIKRPKSVVISYTSDSEETLYNIIDQIGGHKIERNITNYLNIKSYLRENKIKSIIDNKNYDKFTHLVINTDNIKVNLDGLNTISSILVSSILDNVYCQLLDEDLKLIILTPFIETYGNGINQMIRKSVHTADLYLTIKNNNVSILKDREE